MGPAADAWRSDNDWTVSGMLPTVSIAHQNLATLQHQDQLHDPSHHDCTKELWVMFWV